MKKYLCKLKEKLKAPLATSLIINIVIFFILNIITYTRFLCNIDIMMQAVITNVIGGQESSYAVFMNIFILKVLKTLYLYFPKVSWYMLLQVSVCFVSLTSMGKSYLSEKKLPMHRLIYVVFCLLVGFECYIYPSYVKSSFLLCFSMVVKMIKVRNFEKKQLLKLIGIISGLILSGMLSRIAFIAGIIAGVFCYLMSYIYTKSFGKYCLIHFVVMVVSVGSIVALWGINDERYAKKTQNWNIVKEYQYSVEKIELFGWPDYTDEMGQNIGLSEEKYNCIANSDIYLAVNDEGLSILKKISKETLKWNFENIKKYFHTVPIRWIKVSMSYLLLIACIFLYQSNAKYKKAIIVVAIIWTSVLYLIGYMNCMWNSKVTSFMVFIPIAYLVMLSIGDKFEISVRENVAFLIVFSIVLYYNFSDQFISNVQNKSMEEVLEQTISDTGITAVDLNNILRQYSAYKPYESGLLSEHNIVIVNGSYYLFERFEPYMYKEELWDQPIILHGNWMDMNLYRLE